MENNLLNDFMEEIDDLEVSELGINIDDTDFRVMNKSQANFFLRKIRDLEADNAEIENFCKEQIRSFTEKTENYKNKKLNSNINTIEYFKTLLQQYADSEIEKNPKKKSYKLPFGTIGYKKSQDKLLIENEKSVIEFLKENNIPGVRVVEKETLDKMLLKSSIETREDGFYIDGVKLVGVAIESGGDVFGVKTIKE